MRPFETTLSTYLVDKVNGISNKSPLHSHPNSKY